MMSWSEVLDTAQALPCHRHIGIDPRNACLILQRHRRELQSARGKERACACRRPGINRSIPSLSAESAIQVLARRKGM